MPRNDHDEDDDRPRKRRPLDDEDDDRPRARRSLENDDFDDRPRRKKKKKFTAQSNVVGIISLIIGILSILFSFIPCLGLYAFIPGGLGLVLGLIGLLLAAKSEGRLERKTPIIGSSISAVAILFGLSWILVIKHWEKKIDKFDKEFGAEVAKAEAERKKELANAANEVKAAGAGGAIRITADQFAQAYLGNEEAADLRYMNKVLEITGIVVELDLTGETYSVHLKAEADSQVYCEFAKTPDVRARLIQLKPGDRVTIRGKCPGGGLLIEACVLVQ
jgi:tRNA_anti-like